MWTRDEWNAYHNANYPWYYRTLLPVGEIMPTGLIPEIVDERSRLHCMSMVGDYRNSDIWLGDSLP